MPTNEVEKKGLISLYIYFQGETEKNLEHHRRHFTQFVAIILAIISISLGLFYQFNNNHHNRILLIISLPIFGIIISLIGIKVCDRFYKRFLEFITISNKLYFLIKNRLNDFDLDDKIDKNKKSFPENVYPTDTNLYPDRWINAMKSCCTSEKFITSRLSSGYNFWIRLVFLIFAGINIIIVIGICYFGLI